MNVKCPKCGKSAVWEGNPHRPFCSESCKTRDLGGWASEEYRVPDERPESEASESGPGPDRDPGEDH